MYVVGAVKNPGLYALATGARVYDLLQAAGGTLPKANLVAINMAAKLSDGYLPPTQLSLGSTQTYQCLCSKRDEILVK